MNGWIRIRNYLYNYLYAGSGSLKNEYRSKTLEIRRKKSSQSWNWIILAPPHCKIDPVRATRRSDYAKHVQNMSNSSHDEQGNEGSSVVDQNTLNLDPDPEFWPNLHQDLDPGLWYQLSQSSLWMVNLCPKSDTFWIYYILYLHV